MTAFRAIETKTPMVRVANTGISAIIEPTGEITARTPLFQRGTEIETVDWRPINTIYTRFGDVFAISCFILALAGLLAAFFYPRTHEPDSEAVEHLFHTNGAPPGQNGKAH
jgi:apolipoprotein N-acyltransferase